VNRVKWRLLSAFLGAVVAASGVAVSVTSSSGTAAPVCGVAPTGAPVGFAPGNKLVVAQAFNGCITINGGVVYKYRSTQPLKVEVSSAFGLADAHILELKPGVTLTQVDTKLAEAGQGGPAGGAAIRWFTGTRQVSGNAFLRGGLGTPGSVEKPSFVRFERSLGKGTYYVAQMRASGGIQPSTTARAFVIEGETLAPFTPLVQRLTVTNPNPNNGYSDGFSAYNSFGGASFNEIKTNAPITVANSTGGIAPVSQRELHFFQWTKVLPGTTNEQVCASYSGGPSRFALVDGQLVRQTFGTLSAGNMVHYDLTVPPGLYWVTSQIPDGDSGVPHSFEHPTDAPLKCEGAIVPVVSQYTPRP
jgi:hypothetical protein